MKKSPDNPLTFITPIFTRWLCSMIGMVVVGISLLCVSDAVIYILFDRKCIEMIGLLL